MKRTSKTEPPGRESKMADTNSREIKTQNSPSNKKEMRSVVLAANAVMFLSFTSMMLYLGVQAFLLKKLGMGDIAFGYLQSVVAVSQLIGGPIYGRLGDVYGTKAVLGLNFVSQTLTYGLTGLSYTLPMAVGARCCSVFLDTTSGAQMAISHATDSDNRASELAKLQVWVAIGGIAGNIIAGQTTKLVGEQTTVLIGVLLCGLAFLLVILYIPSFKKETPVDKEKEQKSTIKIFSSLLRLPGVLPLLFIKILSVCPIMAVGGTFALVGMKYYDLTPEMNSYFAIYSSVNMMLANGVIIGPLSKRYSASSLMKLGAVSLTLSHLILANTTSLMYFIVISPLEMFGMCLLQNIVTAKLTNCAPESETGSLLGLSMSAVYCSAAIAPVLGGYLTVSGFANLGYVSAIVTMAIFPLIRSVDSLVKDNTTESQKNE